MRRSSTQLLVRRLHLAMLDIMLLRTDQGGNPDLVRESQRRRYADVGLVDKVIEYDEEWRQTRGALDLAKKDKNATQKKIGEFMKKKEAPPNELLEAKKTHEAKIAELEAKEAELIASRDKTLGQIGAQPYGAAGRICATESACVDRQATSCRTTCQCMTTRTTTGSKRRGASLSARTGCSRIMT